MALSPGDPNSYARPDQVVTKHIHLELEVDFHARVLHGHVLLSVERVEPTASTLLLDVSRLQIDSVQDGKSGLDFAFEVGSSCINGEKLEISLPSQGEQFQVKVGYRTTPTSTALQWLQPEQTLAGTHPFLFSQCQAIHCRSLVPCQDTPSVKAPYTASITAPSQLAALMSAIRQGEPQPVGDDKSITKWEQKVPVQSYLIAIAVGGLESRKIGPRSHVWAEPGLVDRAAHDFAETESFLQTAEALCGPYVWGIYDILVLPPSFPYGGMENPCLTFATPTLLSGDRSNAGVIAHEIAHSWTGNLVTNTNFEHFWLNEGFTVFTELKIKGRLFGEPARHFAALLRWKELEETVEVVRGVDDPFTALVPKLAGCDPDDAFSCVPYVKGSSFLWHLEDLVGGADVFEPFLKSYYEKFAFKSIDSVQFKAYFLEKFGALENVKGIDWDTWLYSPGMPPVKPDFITSLAEACWDLAKAWQGWKPSSIQPSDLPHNFLSFSTDQKIEFLMVLTKGASLSHETLEVMETMYQLTKCPNTEIEFKWLRLGIKARWEKAVSPALDLVTRQGRMKFVRPIYRDLYNWPEQRQRAIDTFVKNRPSMMHVAADMVAKDLHI